MIKSVSAGLRGLFVVAIALFGASCSSTPPKATAPSYELLITNAQIVDGTGGAARKGSIGIRGGKIAAVGEVTGTATRTIDAKGRTVAPGFIDMHSHSDMPLVTDGNGQSKIRQGVTTEVIGESDSVAPRKQPSETRAVDRLHRLLRRHREERHLPQPALLHRHRHGSRARHRRRRQEGHAERHRRHAADRHGGHGARRVRRVVRV